MDGRGCSLLHASDEHRGRVMYVDRYDRFVKNDSLLLQLDYIQSTRLLARRGVRRRAVAHLSAGRNWRGRLNY